MKQVLLRLLLGGGALRLAARMMRERDLPFDQALGLAVAELYEDAFEETFRREKGRAPHPPELEAGQLYVQAVFERLL